MGEQHNDLKKLEHQGYSGEVTEPAYWQYSPAGTGNVKEDIENHK